MSNVDLTQLPPPEVEETLNFEAILAKRKATLISYYPADQQAAIAATLELESEPLNKLLQENAYNEMILRARINDAAKQTLLAFASSTTLDHVAGEYELERLLVTPGDPSATPPIEPVYESDDRLRMRCQMAYEGMATAGPVNAYKFHALSASAEVADVAVDSPTPGTVRVTILSPAGQPSADTLNLVEQAGSGKLQELIATLKQTQGEAGKVAKVMADNAIGDLDNLTSAWDDVGIQMMDTENGPLRGIIQRVTEIIQVTGDWMRANPELTSTLTRIAAVTAVAAAAGGSLLLIVAGLLGPLAAIKMGLSTLLVYGGPLLTFIKALTMGMVRLGIAMLTTPIGWFIMGIVAIAAGAYLLYKHWDGVTKWFSDLWAQCKAPALAFWELLKELFSWTPIGMLIMHWNEIWAFFDTLPAGAANKGKAIIDGLIGGISAKWESLKNKIKALTDLLPDWMKGGGSVTTNVNPSGYLTGNYNPPAMAGGSGYGPRIVTPVRPVARGNSTTQIHAPISITQQPGQSATDVAQEVRRELDRRERQATASGRASLADRN
ncbi:TPA: phage tail tape measure protein [Aeromonas hydrophila]